MKMSPPAVDAFKVVASISTRFAALVPIVPAPPAPKVIVGAVMSAVPLSALGAVRLPPAVSDKVPAAWVIVAPEAMVTAPVVLAVSAAVPVNDDFPLKVMSPALALVKSTVKLFA